MGGLLSTKNKQAKQQAPSQSKPQEAKHDSAENQAPVAEQPQKEPFTVKAVDEGTKADLKVLILGPGESGKTTYWRQLRYIYTGGLNPQEISILIPGMRMNIISDIKAIIKYAEDNDIHYPEEFQSIIEMLHDIEGDADELTVEVADYIKQLWDDPSSKDVYAQIASNQLNDHSDYFLENVQRIAEDDFEPTFEDILKCRIRTTGIFPITFQMGERTVELVDVGGQMCERSKWSTVLSNPSAVIFVVSLADFDQCMFEEGSIRRTSDSLDLFTQIINMECFKNVPFFLILNKRDEFEQKLSKNGKIFREQYPTFSGDVKNVEECIKHVETIYLSKAQSDRNPNAKITVLTACAVDQKNVEETFTDVSRHLSEILTQ